MTVMAPASTYTVGNMPWFRRVWLSLADRPFVLVFCALLAAVVAGAGIFATLRRLKAEQRASAKGCDR